MKKKILTMAVALVMLATLLPVSALAASANEKKLNKITAADIATYDTALPTGGKKKTKSQINKLLGKINYKAKGSGSSWYNASLSFYKNYGTDPETGESTETYTSASVDKGWSLYKESKDTSYYYRESKPLIASYEGQELKTRNYLSVSTSKKYTTYNWNKGAKTGAKTTGKYSSGGNTGSGKDTRRNFKLYKDEKVLGQKCLVYSYQYKGSDATYYTYVSRKNGQTIKSVYAAEDYASTTIYFERKNVSKSESFYKAPKSVKFTTQKYSAAQAAEAQIQEEILADYFYNEYDVA